MYIVFFEDRLSVCNGTSKNGSSQGKLYSNIKLFIA